MPRYVIGTEVPIPGGAQEHELDVQVTTVENTLQTVEFIREAFIRAGLEFGVGTGYRGSRPTGG